MIARNRPNASTPNVIGFASDTIIAVNFIVDNVTLTLKQAGYSNVVRPVTIASLEELSRINRVLPISPARMSMFIRYGLIGAIATTAYDVFNPSYDVENNKALFFSTLSKNAAGIALMFFGGWVGLGAYVVIEVLWYFLKHHIENSPIEIYIEKSLFYQETDYSDQHNSFSLLKALTSSGGLKFTAVKLLETLERHKTPLPDRDDLFSFNRFLIYLGDLYDQNPSLYEAAMQNEFTYLLSVISGYDIEVQDSKIRRWQHGLGSNDMSPTYKNQIALSAPFFQSSKRLIVSFYDEAKTRYEEIEREQIIDITKTILDYAFANKSDITINSDWNAVSNQAKIVNIPKFEEAWRHVQQNPFPNAARDPNQAEIRSPSYPNAQSQNKPSEPSIDEQILEPFVKIFNNAALFIITDEKDLQVHKYSVKYEIETEKVTDSVVDVKATIPSAPSGYRSSSSFNDDSRNDTFKRPLIVIDDCKRSLISAGDYKKIKEMIGGVKL